jgi:proline iminopeptidase
MEYTFTNLFYSFINKGFFESDSWILDNIDVIKKHNIPGVIVQGR